MHIITGDCLDILPTLPSNSIQCCVTSPPYYALRDYGTGTWQGGDPTCDHKKARSITKCIESSGLHSPETSGGIGHRYEAFTGHCKRCGATRIDQQLGLEATPNAYIDRLVSVFREVRRVLRKNGTCWLVIADCYATSPAGNKPGTLKSCSGLNNSSENLERRNAEQSNQKGSGGVKRKNLLLIPQRLAIALQDDGWFVRSDIIWHKRSVMPESVTDRPTSCHEHVFLLTKSPKYYYDAAAIREPGRNCRNVWMINPKPFKGAHFATMPPALAERCIKAGSKPGDTVLDPFGGSGTTALAAENLGRESLLIELNPDYVELAKKRVMQIPRITPLPACIVLS